MKKLSVVIIVTTFMTFNYACNSDQIIEVNDNLAEVENVVSENTVISDRYNEIAEILVIINNELHAMIIAKCIGQEIKDSSKNYFELANQILRESDDIIADVDMQIEILMSTDFPDSKNFDIINDKVYNFNDIISEHFELTNSLESLTMLKPLDYAEFETAPITYLTQKKIMVLTTTNFLFHDILKDVLGLTVSNSK